MGTAGVVYPTMFFESHISEWMVQVAHLMANDAVIPAVQADPVMGP